ncbi:MAG: S1C family serine protease [Bellilinea sp.]
MQRLSVPSVILVIVLILSACTPGKTVETPAPTQAEVVQPTPAPTAEPTRPVGLVDNLEGVRTATIQLEAQGTFIDPQMGTVYNSAGRGSGFIIDPSGIAVTNNHVVTGAALLKVWVGGEDTPRNARILGVSECWDLAVIDLEGDGYPYVEWFSGEITPGLEVYSAGFPLGDPEYTLTKGIVSKANADGETSWASVDGVIEHDARIRGGNSGGPLVTASGQVVGVNYAGSDLTDQNFAIRGSKAKDVVATMREGKDYESIGINGQAVMSEDGSLSGIWVSSVKSGSPADKTGVQGGDILTTMEGLVLATDGTMADYCDILRTRNDSDTMAVEVLRFDSQEYLEGQLNGRKLETSFSFATELENEVQTEPGGSYDEFVTVQDNYGSIQISLPTAWGEVDGSPWMDGDDVIGAAITAAGSLENFYTYYDEPGVFFGATDDIAKLGGYIQLLDVYRDTYRQDCKLDGRYDYEDTAFKGAYDLYTNCSGTQNTMVLLSAKPQNSTSMLIIVLVQMMTDADVAAFEEILRTFDVIGSLP